MRYMLGFYENDEAIAARARDDETFWRGWRAYFDALGAAGIIVSGAPLEDWSSAVTVNMSGDARTVHDGPYADTREQLAGFVVIDAATLDEALEWAKRCPAAREGAVEVRPVVSPPCVAGDEPPRRARENAKFMLSILESPNDFARRSDPDDSPYWDGWRGFSVAMYEAGIFVDGYALSEPATATVVRVSDDGASVQDGPYADTKEQLGGYLLLDLPSLDEALSWAARCPAAYSGAVEVRPVMKIEARV